MADNENRLESILSRFDADWTASDEARILSGGQE